MKETFNFGQVSVTPNKQYLQPGQFNLTVRSAKYVKPVEKKPDGSPKTPFLDIVFGGAVGEISVKFYITPKAFERIQTIYNAWFGENCGKTFDSVDAIGAFFEKAFSSEKAKAVYKRIIIGGRQAPNGNIYAELPYSNYIIADNDESFKEGPFEKNSGLYIFHVKMNPANPSTNSDSILIPSDTGKQVADMDDDLPF